MKKYANIAISVVLAIVCFFSGYSVGAARNKNIDVSDGGEVIADNSETTDIVEDSAESDTASTEVSSESPTVIASAESSGEYGAGYEVNPEDMVTAQELGEPDIEENMDGKVLYYLNGVPKIANENSYPVDNNLVMVFFGDSQIANGRAEGTDIPSLISHRVPNGNAINLAIGGTTASLEASTTNTENYETWSSNCFYGMAMALAGMVDRNKVLANNPDVLDNMNSIDPAEVDYYFIEYGANDFFTQTPLDIYSAPEGTLPVHTYYGALSMGIDILQKISPNAKIILISPFYGIYKDSEGNYIGDSYITSNGIGTLADYAKKINNVAEDYQFYIFDGMFRSKHDLYLDTVDQYLSDGVHLSLLGRQVMARLLAHIPNSMEHYEPSAFRQCDVISIANFNYDEYFTLAEQDFMDSFPDEYAEYTNNEYIMYQP